MMPRMDSAPIRGWRSFSEFETFVQGLAEEKARGDAFEDFVFAYLRLDPELALTDVWPLAGTPEAFLRRLGLTTQDIGIDFVARRRDGGLCAVQAKFRGNRALGRA